MNSTFIDGNAYAFSYGDGKAWDNRKKKIWKRAAPRGRVYMRLDVLDHNFRVKEMLKSLDTFEEILGHKHGNTRQTKSS